MWAFLGSEEQLFFPSASLHGRSRLSCTKGCAGKALEVLNFTGKPIAALGVLFCFAGSNQNFFRNDSDFTRRFWAEAGMRRDCRLWSENKPSLLIKISGNSDGNRSLNRWKETLVVACGSRMTLRGKVWIFQHTGTKGRTHFLQVCLECSSSSLLEESLSSASWAAPRVYHHSGDWESFSDTDHGGLIKRSTITEGEWRNTGWIEPWHVLSRSRSHVQSEHSGTLQAGHCWWLEK